MNQSNSIMRCKLQSSNRGEHRRSTVERDLGLMSSKVTVESGRELTLATGKLVQAIHALTQ
jgi:hypothetical protein